MDSNGIALKLIHANGKNVSSRLAEALGVSRQAASAKLRQLKKQGLVSSTGNGAGVVYSLTVLEHASSAFQIAGLSEDFVWRSLCQPIIAKLPDNVRAIWQYGITEMVNNAIDHSGAADVMVSISQTAIDTTVSVSDAGEGIFHKIQQALGLFDAREAILELTKGKFTTDPANHSGEGIFFSSKAFDAFDIHSGGLTFVHDAGQTDILLDGRPMQSGTTIYMRLSNDSQTVLHDVFDRFAQPDEYTFAHTIVPVRLAQHEGEMLVSRSQAKRLVRRFERFTKVLLDFAGVEDIGQAFADEVFRVFQHAHPGTTLATVNVSPRVQNMISRALAA